MDHAARVGPNALLQLVPVLDRAGAFQGTVSKNQLLQTLSRH